MINRYAAVGALVVVSMCATVRADEMVVIDWDLTVEESCRGFPRPSFLPGTNGNWTSPVDYAGGTMYLRAHVKSRPPGYESYALRMQMCIFQNSFTIETCCSQKDCTEPGVYTWSHKLSSWWKKDGVPIDWSQPRSNMQLVVKNGSGVPVSNYSSDWADAWADREYYFPMELHWIAVIVSNGATFSGWDNYVGGTTTPPGVATDDATNVTTTAARLNGEVTSTGGSNPTVKIYWGDNDGGTNAGSWDHVEDLGARGVGDFYQNVTELTPGTQYHFRCYASNSAGGTWASASKSFTTQGSASPPTVTTNAATNVGTTSARLNGSVTDTGGQSPTVTVYWGDNDGGTDAGAWDHAADLGTKSVGAFSYDASGLGYETTYYYRCYAENSAGGTWAPSRASFTTQPNTPPVAGAQTVTVAQGYDVAVSLEYDDPDGGPGPYVVEIVSSPTDGTLSGSGTSYTYSPDSGFAGTDSFAFRVNDGISWGASATVTVNVVPDSDGDGLPDAWEQLYGLDPTSADSDGDGTPDDLEDEDDDGLTNMQEYLAGSDPTVADAPGGSSSVLSCRSTPRRRGRAGAWVAIYAFVLVWVLHRPRRCIPVVGPTTPPTPTRRCTTSPPRA